MPKPVQIFDASLNRLERAMDIATRQQEVITHNIANAKTPGYQPMTFDEHLMRAVERTDRDKVVLEEELAALSENSIKYSSYVKLMTSRLNTLRTIASQGRR